MKTVIHNITVGKGELHGQLSNGEKVTGFYRIEEDDTVTLLDLVAHIEETDPCYTPEHTTYDLPPSEVDYAELEDVISMKLGRFATNRAKNY